MAEHQMVLGEPNHDSQERRRLLRRTSCVLPVWFVLLVLNCCVARIEQPPPTEPQPLASFPLTDEPVLPLVSIDALDQCMTCLFDSGSDGHVFGLSYAQHLVPDDKPTHVFAPSGATLTVATYRQPPMRLADILLVSLPGMYCMDLQLISSVLGQSIDGVIGVPAFDQFVVRIDPDAARLDLFAAGSFSALADGTTLPLSDKSSGPALAVPVALGMDSLEVFRIDTGDAGTGALSHATLKALLDRGLATIVRQTGVVDAAGVSPSTIVRVATFGLGPFSHADLDFTVGVWNTIGMGYLSQFVVVLDSANRRINLKPGTGYGKSGYYRFLGLLLLSRDGDIYVGAVISDSRAGKAGFVTGDVILSVSGIDRSEHTFKAVRKALRTATHSLDVTVKRGDETRVLHIMPEM